MAKVKVLSMERYSKNMADPLEQTIESVISNTTASTLKKDDLLGDVQTGGFFKKDLDANNVMLDQSVDTDTIITESKQQENAGMLFLKQTSSNTISPSNVMFHPRKVAEFFEEFADIDPSDFLMSKGAEAYIKVFGTMTPSEASSSLKQLAILAASVKDKFDEDEVITDAFLTDSTNENTYVLDIQYGDPQYTPIVETLVSVDTYAPNTGFRDSVRTVVSKRRIIEWSDLYRIGNSLHNKELPVAELGWDWPFDFPQHKPEISKHSKALTKVPVSNTAIESVKHASSEPIKFANLFSSTDM